MLTIWRVIRIDWRGKEYLGRAFLNNDKAQSYAKEWRNLNKIEQIEVREEKVYQ